MMFLLIKLLSCSTERAIPSYWLNNWDSKDPIIGFWFGAHNSFTQKPTHRPGINHLRAFSDLSRDIITDDSFAFKLDGTIYGDPMQMNNTHIGGCVQDITGELWTEYTHYGRAQLPIKIRRSFFMPPNEKYYMVKYSISSTDGKSHTLSLLDYLVSAQDNQWTLGNCNNGICKFDEHQSFNPSMAISVDSKYSPKYTMGNGDYSDSNAHPLTRFAKTGDIPNYPEYNQQKISFGALYENIQINPGQTIDVIAYRAVGRSIEDAVGYLQAAISKGSNEVIKLTQNRYSEWLSKGVQPTLTGDSLDFYLKSLLLLKNSQNPSLGTIASSLHPLYGYKNWMRDSMMAAFMLDAAGYHDEARKFFDWIPKAPKTDNGGWHTCYDTFTGNFAPFVEPQYDSAGLYLIAMNYHLKTFGDKYWIRSHLPTIEAMANFLLFRGRDNLAISDRSPWEESTDHHTKQPIAEQYYSWSQGCIYGGLVAASLIENIVGTSTLSSTYITRANEIKESVKKNLWDGGRLYRGLWADTFQPDKRADSASMSCVFTGLLEGNQARQHLDYIVGQLTHLNNGIARYTNDPYFYDSVWNPCGEGTKETQMGEPSWPVVTAYVAWSEIIFGIDIQKRLDWMVQISAYGNMPIGEAVDSADGALIMPSAPDVFEHAGVYVYTTLLKQNKVPSILNTLNN